MVEHPANFVDLTGKRFGSWTVSGLAYQKNWRLYWNCICDCGNERFMRGDTLMKIQWPYCSKCKPHNTIVEISTLDLDTRKQVRERNHSLFSNTLIIDNDLVYGYSSDSFCFIFDRKDLDVVKPHTWRRSQSRGYISTNIKKKFTYLHTLIMGDLLCKQKVDHINLDKYDNRRCNFRFCNDHENSFNRGIMKTNTLGYKGLQKTPRGRYGAIVGFCKHHATAGYYAIKEEAAAAYDYASALLHGDFAKRNCDIFSNVGTCSITQKQKILAKLTDFLDGLNDEKYKYLIEQAKMRVQKEREHVMLANCVNQ